MRNRSAPAALAFVALASTPACLPRTHAQPLADTTISRVGFVAQVGGYIYADVETSPLLPSPSGKVQHQLLIIDPKRAAAGGATAAANAILRSVPLDSILLTGQLDATTLLGTGATADGTTGTIVTMTAADPLAPVVATTAPLPSTFFGVVTPLPDGNVIVGMQNVSDAPIDKVAIMNPRTGDVRSTTDRLSCASWLPVGNRLLCLGPSNSVRIYDYTADGGLGAVVTAMLVPNASDFFSPYAAGAGGVYWIDGKFSTSKVVAANVGDAGDVTITGETDVPMVSGQSPLIFAVTPFGRGRMLFDVTSTIDSGIAVHDFRSTPATFAVTDIGVDYCLSLAALPVLGSDVFVAGTSATGVRVYRLDDAGHVTLLGFVKPPS